MILRLELHKFGRFALNNIETFTYTPKAKIQIIRGTNGIGKSSLLNELTPLPADLNKDYLAGGYKHIIIKHNNKVYNLMSGVNGTTKHSFKIDGKEKNDGGTRKVQLVLVKDAFNITPTIHAVMTGENTFTNMSTNERKDWFSLISSNDYTYALGVFKRLSVAGRDFSGAIKLLNGRLTVLEKDILSDETYRYLESKRATLEVTLNDILKNYVAIDAVNDNSTTLLSLVKRMGMFKNLRNLNEVIELLQFKTGQVSHLKTSMEKVENELVDYNDKKPVSYIVEKEKEIKDIQHEINTLTPCPFNVSVMELKMFLNDKYDIDNILLDMDDSFIPETISELTTRNVKASDEVLKLTTELDKLSGKIEGLEVLSKTEETVCPQCSYKWVDKYDKHTHTNLLRKRSAVKNDLSRVISISNKLTGELTHKTEQLALKTKLAHYLDSSVGQEIKKFMIDKHLSLFMVLNIITTEINNWEMIETLTTKISKMHEELEVSNKITIKNLKELITGKEKELHSLVTEYYTVTKEMVELEKEIIYLKRAEQYRKDIVTNLDKYNQFKKTEKITKLNLIKEAYIVDIKKEIRRITIQLDENNGVNGKIIEAEEQVVTYKDKQEKINKLLTALSPKEGLIAINIMSTLGTITDHMNSFINKIWSYSLIVNPPKLDTDTDLVYKFPVTTSTKPTPDVSKTSTGMREIINLAFKLTSIYKLKLTNHPLILDEFGPSLSENHRESAYSNLAQVINDFQQVFIVSHFSSIHGRYTNVDIIDLSNKGSEVYQITYR